MKRNASCTISLVMRPLKRAKVRARPEIMEAQAVSEASAVSEALKMQAVRAVIRSIILMEMKPTWMIY